MQTASELVLAGGGHSHVEVVRRFGAWRLPNVRLTLVSREAHTPYSGMLPGLVAGHYSHGEAHIDLPALCSRHGVRFVHGEVTGLDLAAREMRCADGSILPFDLLSLDTGAAPDPARVPGASGFTVPVKPVSTFLENWNRWLDHMRKSSHPMPRVVVVGGGAGGTELAMAVRHRLRSMPAVDGVPAFGAADIRLVTASEEVVPTHVPGFRRRVRRILRDRGITVLAGSPVVSVEDGLLRCGSGVEVPFDLCIWVTAVSAPAWPRASGLATDKDGFVAVDDCLRSVSHPSVFASGDLASMVNHPRPRAGVFAVRQGPPLAENLRRVLQGKPPRGFQPQRQFLTLMGTGDARAVGARGRLVFEGAWVWRWKQRIDRRWIRRYQA